MKKIIKRTLLFLFLSLGMTTVFADCVHNGVVYPEGAEIGGKICVGGEWISP